MGLDPSSLWIGRHDRLGRWRRPRACVLRRRLAPTGLSCCLCARCPSTCLGHCTAPRMAPAPAGPRPPPWTAVLHCTFRRLSMPHPPLALDAPSPFALSLSKRCAGFRQAQPERVGEDQGRGKGQRGAGTQWKRARPMPADPTERLGRWCRCAGAGAIRGAVQCPRRVDTRRAHPSCRTTVSASLSRRTHTGAAGRVQAHTPRTPRNSVKTESAIARLAKSMVYAVAAPPVLRQRARRLMPSIALRPGSGNQRVPLK